MSRCRGTLASTVYYQLIGNHDRVVDGYMPGLGGRDLDDHRAPVPTDAEFTLAMGDRFASQYDISDTASYPVADLAYYPVPASRG